MRTHHKTTVLAAAALTALSLGLTACGGETGTGAKDAGSASSSQQAAGTADTTTGTDTGATGGEAGSGDTAGSAGQASAKGSTTGGSTSGGAGETGTTGSSGGKASAEAPACAHGDIKITAAKADEVPTEHIVLTATNTSGGSCTLLQYPLIAFGDIQTAKDVPAVAKSKPAAPVVLQPGTPAYANVRVALGGVDEENKVVKSFNVNLFAADGPAEGSIVVDAPAGGLAVDEAAAKTGYWTHELRNGADEF
ncbi:DUF4232 domain-containing protein [Streptomyces sp. NBC_00094]|uniref:DUF4232 domain-containing protein n=1 Tax=Streptomyces sp. NBC_00094 TaxID=2903620 RepID=UPI00225207A4|nr:DUF4232 domain-containing protein [Streptomyces sp. NBC_00094]MCX5392953.1 DUF4232 domain-containing protein [Streptomyces sp. NBC_00094]